MDNQINRINLKELLSTEIAKDIPKFLTYLEVIDSSPTSREIAVVIKKAMEVHKNSTLAFLLKKSFRLAAFKLKGAEFKISLSGLSKLLKTHDRLDDLALALASVKEENSHIALDCIKSVSWQDFPSEILPCFCQFFKKYGTSRNCYEILELTNHSDYIVKAAAIDTIVYLDKEKHFINTPTSSKPGEIIDNNEDDEPEEEEKESSNTNTKSEASSNDESNEKFEIKETKQFYNENKRQLLSNLKTNQNQKEIVKILKLIRKFGSFDDAAYAKPFLLKEKQPDLVRAAIKVLEKLEPDYLVEFLPTLLRSKANKVRLTATRAFQAIDKESAALIVLENLKSLNAETRSIGITTAMLVDFKLIRDDFLQSFANETNGDLLDKIGLIFVANPDRQIVNDLYFVHMLSKTILKKQREDIIKQISEKVSFALNNDPWPQELIQEAKKNYEDYMKEIEAHKDDKDYDSTKVSPQSSLYKKIVSNNEEANQKHKEEVEKIKIESEKVPLFVRIKSILITLFLVGAFVLWGIIFVLLLSKIFF